MTLQFVFILLFTLFVTASSILTKSAFNKKGDVYAFTFVHNLMGSLIVLPLLFFDHRLPTNLVPWILLSFGSLCSMIGDYYYFRSLALEEVSVVTLVFRFRLVLVFFIGALFYNEDISVLKIIAVILITAGPLIIGYDGGKFKFSKGVIFALLSNLFLSMLFVVDKRVSDEISVPLYTCINFFTSSLFFLFLYLKQKKKRCTLIFHDAPVVTASIAGILLSLASLSRRYSFHFGEISIATPLLNISVVTTLILGVIILKENQKLAQKALGAILVISGAIVLGL